jgi:hypothetical protein
MNVADITSMLLQGIAAVLTKIASASTVAQVATGLGVTVAGVTGAGAAGVLPGPIQDGVAGAIESVTPFDVPNSADDRVTGVDDAVRHATEPAQTSQDSPGASPSEIPVVSTPTVPSPTPEVEPGDDDGVHQHRGGRTPTVAPAPAPAPVVVDDSPEVENHDSGNDDAGNDDAGNDGGSHGGDDSGQGGSDSGHGGSDSSGHGSDD